MSGPAKIRKVAQKPTGEFKLQGVFPKPFPKKVDVAGANPADKTDVRGNSGTWISNNFYQTLLQTLNLLDANDAVIATNSYNANGDVISQCFAEFGIVEALISGNSIIVSWAVNDKIKVSIFLVERSTDYNPDTGAGIFTNISGDLSVATFSFEDKTPAAGDNYYRVTAKCSAISIAAISETVIAM